MLLFQGIMDKYMEKAIEEAQRGAREGGIPIGSVLIQNGNIIGKGHNQRVQNGDPTAHAEIDCLRNAGRLSQYHDTVLYSTLMPCYLCAGAVVLFGIPTVIAGESKTFAGAQGFLESHGVEVINLNLQECHSLMKRFIEEHPDIWNEDIGGKG